MKMRFYASLSLLILITFWGCSGSSEVEMNQAQAAMEKADRLHAASLAPNEFKQAQTAWDHAQAADKEGKTATAKVLFSSAKIYFGKAADVATARQSSLSRELNSMQLMISSNFEKVQFDLANNNLTPQKKSRVQTIASEVEQDNTSIDKLVKEEELLKAVALAKEVQTKIYNAQLILAGQSPSKLKR